jgi:hypothetical protein
LIFRSHHWHIPRIFQFRKPNFSWR